MSVGRGFARGFGAYSLEHSPLWFRLEALSIPPEVGAAAAPSLLDLEPGARYRARIALTGLASFASKSRLESEFKKLGFEAQAFDAPPPDWPPLERVRARSGETWWIEGVYRGDRKSIDPAALERDGVRFLWISRVDAIPAAVPPAAPAPVVVPAAVPPAVPPAAPAAPSAAPPAGEDAWALGVVDRAWASVHGAAPSSAERLFVAALSRGESHYGKGYGEAKNWGSIHAKGPPCGPGSIPWTDKDAQGRPYATCMRAYDTDEAAAADVVRQLTTRRPRTWAAMRAARPLEEIAAELRAERYYEASVPLYAKMLRRNLDAILKNTGLADPFGAAAPSAPSAPSDGGGGGAVFVVLGLLGVGAFVARKR